MQKAIKLLINPHNKKLWPIAILCGALFGLFYQSIVISGARDRFKEFEETIGITKKKTRVTIDIPSKDTYLLKLRGGFKEHNQPSQIFVNNHLLEKYVSKRKRLAGTTYKIIPADLIQRGQNELKIICPKKVDPPFRLALSYRNYRKAIANGKIFILFDSSKNLPDYLKIGKVAEKMLMGILLFGGIWVLGSFGLIKILYLSERKIYLYGLISFIFCLLIFSLYYLASIYSPYYIAFSMGYFWTFVITLVCMSNICLISRGIWLEYKSSRRLFKVPSFLQYLKLNRVFGPIILNQNVFKTIEWLKGRELSDKLILSFMALLVMCALLLIFGMEPVAERFANVAYFALVIGVGIKFVKFIREERTKDEKD